MLADSLPKMVNTEGAQMTTVSIRSERLGASQALTFKLQLPPNSEGRVQVFSEIAEHDLRRPLVLATISQEHASYG
jgi:hypothetical protein